MLLLERPKQPKRVVADLPTLYEQTVAQIKLELDYMLTSVQIEGEEYRCFRIHYSEEIYQASLDRIVKARIQIKK